METHNKSNLWHVLKTSKFLNYLMQLQNGVAYVNIESKEN